MRKLNWVREPKDGRDRRIREMRALRAVLGATPAAMTDLRGGCSEIEDQGELGSCTAHALAGATEYLSKRQNGGRLPYEKSRLYAYYNGRRAMGPWYVRQDSGCFVRTVTKAAARYGICDETLWRYDVDRFKDRPSVAAYADGSRFQVTEYAKLTGDTGAETLRNVRISLTGGLPVMFGFDVYESFLSKEVAWSGVAALPAAGEKLLGGHAVLAVGHDDAAGCLIVRNSWGKKWGQVGYFTLPYGFVTEGLADDFWVVSGQEEEVAAAWWFSGVLPWMR